MKIAINNKIVQKKTRNITENIIDGFYNEAIKKVGRYGNATSGVKIAELQAPSTADWFGIFVLITFGLFVIYLYQNKDKFTDPSCDLQEEITRISMAAGVLFLGSMHIRNAWYIILGAMPAVIIALEGFKFKVPSKEKVLRIPPLFISPAMDIESVRAQRDVLLKNMKLGFQEGGTEAYYSPSKDSITMPPSSTFLGNYGYMSTFLHECGHATGHESRLSRDLTGRFGSPSYAKEELRAEIASAFISQALGFGAAAEDLSGAMENHKAYIQSWIAVIEDQPNELFAAIKDAEAISDYLLEKGEFLEISQEHDLPEAEQEIPQDIDTRRLGDKIANAEHRRVCATKKTNYEKEENLKQPSYQR